MIIDCISDLHDETPNLSGGDLLIFAGDIATMDHFDEYDRFFQWFETQNYKKKIIIGGNHDNYLIKQKPKKFNIYLSNATIEKYEYLCDSGTEFTYYDEKFPEEDEGFLPSGKRTLKIWGAPWTKSFYNQNPQCMAFSLKTKEEMAEKWAKIPEDIDILITHTPPFGMLDKTRNLHRVGCDELSQRILKLKKLKLHVFGHIHEGYGSCYTAYNTGSIPANEVLEKNIEGEPVGHLSVNASHMNRDYEPVNAPIRIELIDGKATVISQGIYNQEPFPPRHF